MTSHAVPQAAHVQSSLTPYRSRNDILSLSGNLLHVPLTTWQQSLSVAISLKVDSDANFQEPVLPHDLPISAVILLRVVRVEQLPVNNAQGMEVLHSRRYVHQAEQDASHAALEAAVLDCLIQRTAITVLQCISAHHLSSLPFPLRHGTICSMQHALPDSI